MNFKKLSLAAAISISMLTFGNAVEAATNYDFGQQTSLDKYSLAQATQDQDINAQNAEENNANTTSMTPPYTNEQTQIPGQPRFAPPPIDQKNTTGEAAPITQSDNTTQSQCVPIQTQCVPVQTVPTQQALPIAQPTGGAAPTCPIQQPVQQCPTGGASSVYQQQPMPMGQPVQPVCPSMCLPLNQPTPAPTCPTGGAAPVIQQPIQPCPCPTGGAAPIIQQPIQPCPCPTGGAAPINSIPAQSKILVPYNQQIIVSPGIPTGGAAGINGCATGGAAYIIPGPASLNCQNMATDTNYLQKQVYAFPSVGGNALVMPLDNNVIQIGTANTPANIDNIGPYGITGAAANIVKQPQNSSSTSYLAEPLNSQNSLILGASVPFISRYGVLVSRSDPSLQKIGQNMSIETASGMPFQTVAMVPGTTTGAAASVTSSFTDIPYGYWASNDIQRLASAGAISGYPDNTFKPNKEVSRAEFASALVSGLNLEGSSAYPRPIFKDVPSSNWAKQNIDKAYNRGLIAGFPDNTFRPTLPVTRAEALTSMAKDIPGTLTSMQANQILSNYQDGDQVPGWARTSVAKALNAGLMKDFPQNGMIAPNQDATRAEVASMLQQTRERLALAPTQPTITGAAAMVPENIIMSAPTLSVKFTDQLNARTSQIGDKFVAKTLEPVTINCVTFPTGSKVSGNVVEVVRPGENSKGAIKVSFDKISYNKETQVLPQQVLAATVQKTSQPNIAARILQFPFTFIGKTVGIAGRTVGSMTMVASNATEGFFTEIGTSASDLAQKQPGAAGRSALSSLKSVAMGGVDLVKTGASGAVGLVTTPVQEVAYITDPSGTQVSSINPAEQLSISFGCQ